MGDILLQLGYEVLAIAVPALVIMTIELLRRKLGIENLKKIQIELEAHETEIMLIKELAVTIVRKVEQKHKDKKGDGKLIPATELLAESLHKIGIQLTEEELDTYIHDALRQLKDEFGEQWANAVADNPDQ